MSLLNLSRNDLILIKEGLKILDEKNAMISRDSTSSIVKDSCRENHIDIMRIVNNINSIYNSDGYGEYMDFKVSEKDDESRRTDCTSVSTDFANGMNKLADMIRTNKINLNTNHNDCCYVEEFNELSELISECTECLCECGHEEDIECSSIKATNTKIILNEVALNRIVEEKVKLEVDKALKVLASRHRFNG